jgi:hypothetical protein
MSADGYHRRKGRKVPYLTPAQKKARLQWAKRHKGQRWGDVIWSDECYIYLGDSNGTVYVTRRAEEVYHEDCLIPTFKQSPIRIMVWGCIMDGKKGLLIALEYPGGKGGGFNSARYQEQVLDGVLEEFYTQAKKTNPNIMFQQDGAPSHTRKSTKKHIAELGIKLFPHPASSPDISPIEPLWHNLKSGVRGRPHLPTSFNELKVAVLEAWDAITDEDVAHHTSKMDARVEALLAAKGGHIPF